MEKIKHDAALKTKCCKFSMILFPNLVEENVAGEDFENGDVEGGGCGFSAGGLSEGGLERGPLCVGHVVSPLAADGDDVVVERGLLGGVEEAVLVSYLILNLQCKKISY